MGAYDYEIYYKKTADHSNADGLSRLPVNSKGPDLDAEVCQVMRDAIAVCPIQLLDLKEKTASDGILQQIIKYVKDGLP